MSTVDAVQLNEISTLLAEIHDSNSERFDHKPHPTTTESLIAFCMATHPRLGRSSPARFLSTDLVEHICGFLNPQLRNVELNMERMTVHLVNFDASGEKVYMLSNLRRFEIEVALRVHGSAKRHIPCATGALQLEASLVYEDGSQLPMNEIFSTQTAYGMPPLLRKPRLGEAAPVEDTLGFDCPLDGSRAALGLQMGRRTISSLHGHRRFRIQLAPIDADIRNRFPNLTLRSEPLKVACKLKRRGAPPSVTTPMTMSAYQLPPSSLSSSLPNGHAQALPGAGPLPWPFWDLDEYSVM